MLARKWLLILGNRLLGFAAGFFVTYFVARGLGPSRYGILGFGLSFVGIFAAIGDLGFNSAHIKKISETKNAPSYIGVFLAIKAVLNFIFACAVLAGVYFVKRFKGGFESPTHEYVIYIALISSILQNFLICFTLTFDARLEVAKSQIVAFVSTVIGSMLSIIVAIAFRSVLTLAAVSIVSNLAAMALALWLFRGYEVSLPSMRDLREYFTFAFPLMVTIFIASFYYYADRLFIQAFWSSEQVGYYYGAQKFPVLLLMISETMIYLLFARMSGLHAEKNYAGLRDICRKSERYLSLAVTPLVVFLMIYAKPATELLLGDSFMNSVPILRLLLIQALVYTINRPSAVLILGINKPKIQAILTSIVLPFSLALYFILIPSRAFGMQMLGLGAVGAALALVIAAVTGFILTKIVVYRLAAVLPYWGIALHIALAVLGSMFTLFLRKSLSLYSIYYLPLFFVLSIAVYLSLLILFKEINLSDYRFVIEIIDLNRIKKYLKTELRLRN